MYKLHVLVIILTQYTILTLKISKYHPNSQGVTPKLLDHYLHLDQDMLQPLWCFLFIYSSKKTKITIKMLCSSFYHPGTLHKISLQSVRNCFEQCCLRSNKTDKQTNTIENITSFAKEVKITGNSLQLLQCLKLVSGLSSFLRQ